MSPSINNSKCVLVTGATSGIGRALALAIAALPSHPKVIGVGRRKDRLAGLKEAGLEGEEFDVGADRAATKTFVEQIIKKYPEVCRDLPSSSSITISYISQIDTIIFAAGVQREFHVKRGLDLDGEFVSFHTS